MLNPYNYTPTQGGEGYKFTTDSGATYVFYFRLASEHLEEELPFSNDVYEFSFEPVGDKPKQKDSRVQDTVIRAISDLLSDNNRVLLYICDSLDEKHYCRMRLFDNWVKKYGTDEIVKIDFEVEESKAIGSIILYQSNPNLNLIRAFLEDRILEYSLWKG